MNLVIVESPAKCKKISEILGPTFKVLATMGHIRALEEDLDAVGMTMTEKVRQSLILLPAFYEKIPSVFLGQSFMKSHQRQSRRPLKIHDVLT